MYFFLSTPLFLLHSIAVGLLTGCLLCISLRNSWVVVHSHFTVLVMWLCTAFRLWQAPQATASTNERETGPSLSSALLAGEGTAGFRLRLKEENRDKVIVFFGMVYGIFHLAELAVLSGMRLHRLLTHLGSRYEILQCYSISPRRFYQNISQ